ncbi:hypothetical protein Tsubulata_022813 [Turnera subulata]|uniref:non-specific serine/threonine protein kinase n=1 Tax=Turnera subulata TaxID=218843 RepID=A0A9Q0F1V1_9ROSI|nr:hypothetical protein Tsubulata_022813 [Turnera subulata]
MKRKKDKSKKGKDASGTSSAEAPKIFTAEQIQGFKGENTEFAKGGFGKIYKGVNGGKEIAIKEYVPLADSSHIAQYQNEREHLTNFNHPRIIKLLGYCEEGQNRWLVLDFKPKCLEKENQDWLAKVEEVSFIHTEANYTDPKFFLFQDDNVTICDFGTMTHSSSVPSTVTPAYAAPETSTGPVTQQADIHSLGVMMLQLLTKTEQENLMGDDKMLIPPVEVKNKMKVNQSPIHKKLTGTGCSEVDALKVATVRDFTDLVCRLASG